LCLQEIHGCQLLLLLFLLLLLLLLVSCGAACTALSTSEHLGA
jgi:hypothetical protein